MGYGELEKSEELDWAGLLSKFMERKTANRI